MSNSIQQFEEKPQLWTDIKAYLQNHIELTDERQYDVLTAWIFADWIPEKWDTVPYLLFSGSKNTGKTHSLSILQSISYQSQVTVAPSFRTLLHMLDSGCTLFLDETAVGRQLIPQFITCLNAGYKRGSSIIIRFNSGTNSIEKFNVFGFKAIAGNSKKIPAALESRCITVHMMQNTRDVEMFVDEEQARTLRARLLQWRLWALQNLTIPRTNKDLLQVLPKEFQEILNNRIIELFLPLYLAADDTEKQVIAEYAQSVYHSSQNEVKTP